jgi:4-amino-4-deoxy-L-arabinose transferase-like glycosyltransferase
MQPLAIGALTVGAIMVIGVSVTLVLTRHALKPRPAGINRWQLHGTVPLAAAGLALGAISRGSGQSPATHDVVFATATGLLLGALLCALAGAITQTRHQRTAR